MVKKNKSNVDYKEYKGNLNDSCEIIAHIRNKSKNIIYFTGMAVNKLVHGKSYYFLLDFTFVLI